MIKYLLLFILPFSLYASKILSYNIYERSDRADVMITFDTPYSGIIKQSKSNSKIIIKLMGASIESSKIKKVNSKYLHSLTITPLKNQTQIIASISSNVKLIASKTADAYGLRLRFTDSVASTQKNTLNSKTTDLSALPTKKREELSTSYYLVVGALLLSIILLLIFKKKIQNPRATKEKKSWLFNATTPQTENTPQEMQAQTQTVSIRFQKAIDTTNSVVMLDFGEESYLVLMGNSNILLDKFHDAKPTSQQEFEHILQERNQELEDFLGTDTTTPSSIQPSSKEPLQAYKERAASLIYSDES